MLLEWITLFASAFLSATLVPGSSELYLFSLLQLGGNPWLLVAIAALGNTLGAVVNWLLGLYLLHFQDRRWFYFSPQQVARAQVWFQRYGIWSLLLAWAPVIGDGLTLIAGVMRVPFWFFVLLVGCGKTLRYVFIVYMAGWLW